MKQRELIINLVGLFLFGSALGWIVGFHMGLRRMDLSIGISSHTYDGVTKRIRTTTRSAHKLCATLFLDDRYSPMCFCDAKKELKK